MKDKIPLEDTVLGIVNMFLDGREYCKDKTDYFNYYNCSLKVIKNFCEITNEPYKLVKEYYNNHYFKGKKWKK